MSRESVALAVALAIASSLVTLAVVLAFLRWRSRFRHNALQRSRAVTTGKIAEQLVPHFPEFPLNPREARFLGSPVDYVVFDGLEAGEVRRIVFIEVKTGSSGLSQRERLVREAVRAGRVEWLELRAGGG